MSLRPGVERQQLAQTLRQLQFEASNLRGAGDRNAMYGSYLRWAANGVRMLRSSLPPAEIDRLVLTRRYWMLQAHPSVSLELALVVDLELEERVTELEAARTDVLEQVKVWDGDDVLVVGDTSMYLSQAVPKLEDLVLADLMDLRHNPIRLLIPMIVLDELDNQKDRGQGLARWRASYTLAVLDKFLPDPTSRVLLREANFTPLQSGGIPRGPVTVEVIFDPPRHERLPIADDEIIARTVTAAASAGRTITLITADTGQSMRGRAAGLDVVKIARPAEGDEPAPQQRTTPGRGPAA